MINRHRQTRIIPASARPGARPTGRKGGGGPSDSELTIRWFTPRGRSVIADLADELRNGDGSALAEIVAELSRPGCAEGAVDLRGIDLRGAELANAPLGNADLSGARLAGADLSRAQLQGATLSRANLRGAKLIGADLREADLSRADLRDADLTEGCLEQAKVEGTKFSGASLRRTFIGELDLSVAHTSGADLEQVRRERYVPKRPRSARRQSLGAPPACEPLPAATRRHRSGGIHSLPSRSSAPPIRARSSGSLDEALARLLIERAGVSELRAVIDGREVVLFREQAARQVA